jgi:two-component sensor histidine kinase
LAIISLIMHELRAINPLEKQDILTIAASSQNAASGGNALSTGPLLAKRSLPSAPRTFSVRTLLLVAVVLIVVPAWSFAAYVSWQYAVVERQTLEAAGRSTARALASAIDFRLTSVESAMATLSLSSALRNNDLAAFYNEANVLAQTQRAVVALVSPGGEQILNTNAPFGQSLPRAAVESRYTEAVNTGKTQFSEVVFGNVTKRWLVTVTLPVIHDNQVRYVLVAGMDSILHLGEVLASLNVPSSWTLAVTDHTNTIAARRPNADDYVGKKSRFNIPPTETHKDEGGSRGVTMLNETVQVFYHRVKRPSWVTLVGIPVSEIDDSINQTVAPVLLTGLGVLLASLMAAWTLGRRFTEQLTAVTRAATAFRRGQEVEEGDPTRVTELKELKSTLEAASDERNLYEERLKGLIADKDLLMQEVHHRVKNSLQLVRGVLSLQARSVDNPDVKAALEAASARILTVAEVHHHLYQGDSTAEIHVSRYVNDLARHLVKSLVNEASNRHIHVMATDMIWPSEKVTTLGLIITELVTNAIKYGAGNVTVDLSLATDGSGTLVVEDEGSGFPPQFELGKKSGLGTKFVTNLLRPQDGSIRIDRSVGHGKVILEFNSDWQNKSSS